MPAGLIGAIDLLRGRGPGWVLGAAMLAMLAGCGGAPEAPAPTPVPATDPIAQDTPPPVYPVELACAGQGGEVVLVLSVGADGTPGQVRTERSSRRKALDAAAVAAVKTWRFKSATRRGQPVAANIRVPVKFTAPVMRPDVCFGLDEQQRRARQPG